MVLKMLTNANESDLSKKEVINNILKKTSSLISLWKSSNTLKYNSPLLTFAKTFAILTLHLINPANASLYRLWRVVPNYTNHPNYWVTLIKFPFQPRYELLRSSQLSPVRPCKAPHFLPPSRCNNQRHTVLIGQFAPHLSSSGLLVCGWVAE